jgi:hypothetical protein
MHRSWKLVAGAMAVVGPALLGGVWWSSCPDEDRARLAVAAFHVATQSSPVLRSVARTAPSPGGSVAAEEECETDPPQPSRGVADRP